MEICDTENGEMEIGDFDSEDVIIDDLESVSKTRETNIPDNENSNLNMNTIRNDTKISENTNQVVDVNIVDNNRITDQHILDSNNPNPNHEDENENEKDKESVSISSKSEIEKTENLKRKNSSVHFGPIKNFF